MLIKWQKLLLVSCRAYLSLDKLTSLSGYGLSFCSVSCQNKEPYTTIQELYWFDIQCSWKKNWKPYTKKNKSWPLKLGVRKLA